MPPKTILQTFQPDERDAIEKRWAYIMRININNICKNTIIQKSEVNQNCIKNGKFVAIYL